MPFDWRSNRLEALAITWRKDQNDSLNRRYSDRNFNDYPGTTGVPHQQTTRSAFAFLFTCPIGFPFTRAGCREGRDSFFRQGVIMTGQEASDREEAAFSGRRQGENMETDSILALVKAGRCSRGPHGDHGHLVHAVTGGPGGTAEALCGTRPGTAASWSEDIFPAVTCPRCMKKLAAMARKHCCESAAAESC